MGCDCSIGSWRTTTKADAAVRVDFYHLTASLDRVLPKLVERVVAGGERLVVVAGEERARQHLDRLLWSYQPDAFLPHAQAGAGDDPAQPVLIAPEPVSTNSARNVALADGQWRDAALGFDRAFHLFAEDRIGEARAAWKALRDRDGVERHYWCQDETGRWEERG